MNDAAEKPFEPTPRRIAKARREGNIARAGEFGANCSFAAGALATVAASGLFTTVAGAAIVRSWAAPPVACAVIVLVACLPLGCACAAGTIANLLQNGGLTFAPITPKLERLNPVAGLARIFSRETCGHTTRATFAFSCAALAMAPVLAAGCSAMLSAHVLKQTIAHAWLCAQRVAFAACAVGLLFSVAEYAAARRAWLRKLRMSFEERKRELKEDEGDAMARGRRRSLHRALLRGGIARVKEAAFVVVNPTHVAVALAYAPPRVDVPEILMRAAGELAVRVRDVATELGVPIVENALLARALYRDGRDGEPIPHALYVAVAEVVAALLRARGSAS